VLTDLRGGCVLWLTGLPGSGKSTIAHALSRYLCELKITSVVLDGDALRTGLNSDLGYSAADRTENLRRMAHVATLFKNQGFVVVVATISPAQQHRDSARNIVGGEFIEVFVDTSLEVCEARDPKGLYKRARLGEIPHFTGLDAAYEVPLNPEITLATQTSSVGECVGRIIEFLGISSI
jgi:adenylylsulfate kinase